MRFGMIGSLQLVRSASLIGLLAGLAWVMPRQACGACGDYLMDHGPISDAVADTSSPAFLSDAQPQRGSSVPSGAPCGNGRCQSRPQPIAPQAPVLERIPSPRAALLLIASDNRIAVFGLLLAGPCPRDSRLALGRIFRPPRA